MSGTIKQLEERQLSNEVTLMKWASYMDLLAIVNVKGELALHRLNWQKVWLLPPLEEGDKITNIAWRPDGKLIAITYSNTKTLCLVDIENKNIVHKTQLKSDDPCTCIAWLSLSPPLCSHMTEKPLPSCSGEYLPPLPNLNRSYGPEPERKEYHSNSLDILFLGQENGNIMMYIFGMFYCGTVAVGNGPILQISGGAGKALWTTWKSSECLITVRLSSALLENDETFLSVAQTQAHVECLMDYLSRTLMAISEAWETILLEMDEKLAKYAADKPPGTVAADFLELLMIGTPSPDLIKFLLKDLTEKGLKKLGHSIDMCYSNIQKLVLTNLNSVGMALIYHLAEMKGMVRLGGAYAAMGLREEAPITNAISAAQSFLAKSSEVQQVIDHSMRDYKAFIRWLYTVILRLNEERVPAELSKISQQDLNYIAEFLQGFDKIEINASKRKTVNLEKLGQYLRQDPLQTCFSPDGSEWASMLLENKCLQDHPLITKQDYEGSLLQAHEVLKKTITELFVYSYKNLTDHFSRNAIHLNSATSMLCSQFMKTDGNLMLAVTNTDHKILQLFRINYDRSKRALIPEINNIDIENKQASESSSRKTENQKISDLKFYSQDYLSLLVINENSRTSSLIQLPMNHTILMDPQNMKPEAIINLNHVTDPNLSKPFQDILPIKLAVSGPRKVAAILSENKKKIRLLETEIDLDEYDESLMDVTPSTSVNTSHM